MKEKAAPPASVLANQSGKTIRKTNQIGGCVNGSRIAHTKKVNVVAIKTWDMSGQRSAKMKYPVDRSAAPMNAPATRPNAIRSRVGAGRLTVPQPPADRACARRPPAAHLQPRTAA